MIPLTIELFPVTSIAYLRGWNRALVNFESGLHCKESSHKVAMKYNQLPGVVSVYRDEYQVSHVPEQLRYEVNPTVNTSTSTDFVDRHMPSNVCYLHETEL